MVRFFLFRGKCFCSNPKDRIGALTRSRLDAVMSRIPDLIEFPALKRPDRPNNWLVAPDGFAGLVKTDADVPVFEKTPKQVFDVVMDLVLERVEWRLRASDPDTLRISFIAKDFELPDSARPMVHSVGRIGSSPGTSRYAPACVSQDAAYITTLKTGRL